MWEVQVLTACFLVAVSTARQLNTDEETTKEEYQEEKIFLRPDDLSENDVNDEPEVDESKPERHLGGKKIPFKEEIELNENDLDDEPEEDILEDLGDLVMNDMDELDDFPSHLIDASDMPTLDGRTCFTAWDNLKEIEPEIQMIMTQDPKTHPNKPRIDENEDGSESNFYNPKIITSSKTENLTTVKTPCYRSLHPEKKCSKGKEECAMEGEAGYCDCPLYTVWEGQRFCCPQCACHPTLKAKDNMFKCACIFDTYIESNYI